MTIYILITSASNGILTPFRKRKMISFKENNISWICNDDYRIIQDVAWYNEFAKEFSLLYEANKLNYTIQNDYQTIGDQWQLVLEDQESSGVNGLNKILFVGYCFCVQQSGCV